MAGSEVRIHDLRHTFICGRVQLWHEHGADIDNDGSALDLFNGRGRDWLTRQPVPDDERQAIERHVRELDRLAEDLAVLDRAIADGALEDAAITRLMTITGVNLAVADGCHWRHYTVQDPRRSWSAISASYDRNWVTG